MPLAETIQYELFQSAESSGEVLRGLYLQKKEVDKRTSLAAICRSVGVPSTGYLSDVFKGKKILNSKYWDAIYKYFSLETEVARVLELLIERDLKKKAGEDCAELEGEIETQKLRLTLQARQTLSQKFVNRAFALDVFAALGLKRHIGATLDSLKNFFGRSQAIEVERSVAVLLQEGLIEIDDEGVIRETNVSLHFRDGQNFSQINYLKDAMSDAKERINDWFHDKDVAAFFTATVPTNKENYKEALIEIRRLLESRALDLQSHDAKTIVRFNFQAYTVTPLED